MVQKTILLSSEVGANVVAGAAVAPLMDGLLSSNTLVGVITGVVLRVAFHFIDKLLQRNRNRRNTEK
jgi:uncharacterized membrane protein